MATSIQDGLQERLEKGVGALTNGHKVTVHLTYDCCTLPIDYYHDLELKHSLQACVFEYWSQFSVLIEKTM